MLEKIISVIVSDDAEKAVKTFNKIFTDSGIIEFKCHSHFVNSLSEAEALEREYNCECEEKEDLTPFTFENCLLIATVHEEEQTIDVTDYSTWSMWAEAVIRNFFTTAEDSDSLLEYYAKKLKLQRVLERLGLSTFNNF